jgi:hypothetical protein
MCIFYQMSPYLEAEPERRLFFTHALSTPWATAIDTIFQKYDPNRGGKPMAFRVNEISFDLQIQRSPHVEASYNLVISDSGLPAAFLNNLRPKDPSGIVSMGQIGVINYTSIFKGLRDCGLKDPPSLQDFSLAYSRYVKELDAAEKYPVRAQCVYLNQHLAGLASSASESAAENELLRLFNSPPDYTLLARNGKSGCLFRLMCEFLSHVSPSGTNWTFLGISHRGTNAKLRNGTPFDDTAFGNIVVESGWEMPSSPLALRDLGEMPKTSPTVTKSRHSFGPEWTDLV